MNLRDLIDPTLTVGEDTATNLRISEAVQHGLITFDTNVLLDLYLLDADDANSLFTSLQGPLKERLWLIPGVAFRCGSLAGPTQPAGTAADRPARTVQ